MQGNIKDKKTHEILSSLKLGGIILSGILVLNTIIGTKSIYQYNIIFYIILSLIIIISISALYYAWSFVFIYKTKKNLRLIFIIESIIFTAMLLSVIMVTGKELSPYKIILLFIIIPMSIQFSYKVSITASALCALFLISIDLIYGPRDTINTTLENDIIISSVYIVIAWFLSYYVKLEKEHATMLENKATIDSLTGLYNHRFFHDSFKNIFELDSKEKQLVSLIFIDIDYFKEYNDLYGHLKGDAVLRNIGSALKDIVSQDEGIICRYGGDEFAIILTKNSNKQVVAIAENIRIKLELMHFEGQEHLPSKNVTASIGIAYYSESMQNYTELIKYADDALYRAKFINKNKVEVYSSVFDMIKSDIEEEHFDLITSIKTLISVINAKDRYTYGHVERVVTYVKMFANEIILNDFDKKTLIYSAYMHDIGKVNVPEVVLNKKTPLNEEEWQMIRQHPQNGVEIVNKVDSLANTAPIIKHHHERYDGKGYPSGLKGDEIPYLSRMLTIVDSFDAMTFTRPYRPAMSFSKAIDELKKCSGEQFDPHLTKVFIKIINNLKGNKDSYVPQIKDNDPINKSIKANEKE